MLSLKPPSGPKALFGLHCPSCCVAPRRPLCPCLWLAPARLSWPRLPVSPAAGRSPAIPAPHPPSHPVPSPPGPLAQKSWIPAVAPTSLPDIFLPWARPPSTSPCSILPPPRFLHTEISYVVQNRRPELREVADPNFDQFSYVAINDVLIFLTWWRPEMRDSRKTAPRRVRTRRGPLREVDRLNFAIGHGSEREALGKVKGGRQQRSLQRSAPTCVACCARWCEPRSIRVRFAGSFSAGCY